MLNYSDYLSKSDKCISLAIKCWRRGDVWLSRFWGNAGRNYMRKALELEIK